MELPDPSVPRQPPSDPEEWTDEEWIQWLELTDPDTPPDPGGGQPGTRTGRFVRSGGGRVLGDAMLGMARAMYGQHHDEVVVVAEGDSEPEENEPFTVHLDPDHPEKSFVVFRSGSDPPA